MHGAEGKLYVVGIGPGAPEHLTARAVDVIDDSEVIIGYDVYLDLIGPLIKGKQIVQSKMGAEPERARLALEQAAFGKRVALISGGDPGIYGMAGPVIQRLVELPPEEAVEIRVEVVPGISAASVCAALVGAPLTQDYVVMSLSDRFVPWEIIHRRLVAAMDGDFVLVIYEPSSRHRPDNMRKAWEVISSYRLASTPVAVIREATREGQRLAVTTLDSLMDFDFDMRTTVIVGSSQTLARGKWMVTRRFYEPPAE